MINKSDTLEQTKVYISADDFANINTQKELIKILDKKNINYSKPLRILRYERELVKLQIELVKLQTWIRDTKKRVVVIFEGRDAAGKGGTIRRFREHLNPRAMRVVALTNPNEVEKGQWYFRRYVKELPNPGEIVFFDRSWYNRAVVEPVNKFCSKKDYYKFIQQVPEFEHMLYEDGVKIIKFWFSISKEEQLKRFESRKKNPLKQWKLSRVDERSQELWDKYTYYKEEMFSKTHTTYSPWIIVESNSKRKARLESMRYVLSNFDYPGKESARTTLYPDPNTVKRFHRSVLQID
ncbi:MAG TPA: polyphosphate kinase 2 [Cyclobacteriaceae bacterium]|jgi:polyphosphate kinase 2